MRDVFQKVIADRADDNALIALSNVEITVANGGTWGTGGQTLNSPYQDPTSGARGPAPTSDATSGPNPFITGPSGLVEFWMPAGFYDIHIRDLNPGGARIPERTIQWNAAPMQDRAVPSGKISQLSKSDLQSIVQQMLWDTGDVKETAKAVAAGSEPAGWLLCDGRAVSRSTYAALYAALGGATSPHGQGDGSTTFNLPDYQGRLLVGRGTHAEVLTVGLNDGLVVGSRKLKHRHSKGSLSVNNGGDTQVGGGNGGGASAGMWFRTDNPGTSTGFVHSHGLSGEIGDTAGPLDGPAYSVINRLIKT